MNNFIFISFVFLYCQVKTSYQWNPPSFISNWLYIQGVASSDIIVPHPLNEVPVKVDVQIKIVKDGEDYIFTGTGTAQRDDDVNLPYGGLVYVYDATNVILYPPADGIKSQIHPGVAYTGSTTDYNGPSSARGWYDAAHARIRAWKQSDFPAPLFSLNIPISDAAGDSFKQVLHGSSLLPDLVIAQVQLDTGYISEGQGNIFQEETATDVTLFGGVVFGYDSKAVKLWVPYDSGKKMAYNGAVFVHGDGLGINQFHRDSATVVLKGYQLDKAFQSKFSAGHGLTSPGTINFGDTYSIDTALVMVQVKEDIDGPSNAGMIFNGVGSAMTRDTIYSGVVYVYTNESALLYTPSECNPKGYMVYIGDRWGNGQYTSKAKTAEVIVTVFSDPMSVSCSGTVLSTTTFPTVSTTVQNVVVKCTDPGAVYNGNYSLTGLQQGDNVNYECYPGTQQQAGNALRTCQANGTWDGIPIVCVDILTCNTTGNSAAVLHTPESLAGSIEQTKKDIKIEKKETSAYKRTLISVKDNRPSATYIGTGGVIVLCALVIAMITPDVFTFFRHCRFFPSIYGQK